jgi:hypothetical protein
MRMAVGAHVGFCILTADDTGFAVTNEDGEQFLDLETAVRHHAEELLKINWQWTTWPNSPPAHRSRSTGENSCGCLQRRGDCLCGEAATNDAA